MRRREFLCGVAASALAAPAVAKTTHTFNVVSFGNPNADRITMGVMQPGSVVMVKQANGGWTIMGGERCNVGDSFTFDPGSESPVVCMVEKRHETI